jgi:hypothetical protein
LSPRVQRGRYTIDLDWTREVDGVWSTAVIRIENALSISVSHGFDQDISQATIVVPYPIDERITLRMSGRIYMGTSDVGGVAYDGHWYQLSRFSGYITEIDYAFAPGTAAITFSDTLVVAQYVYPRNVLSRQIDPSWPSEDFAGLTDQEVVVAVLQDCSFFFDPALIQGTGAVMSPDPLIWPEVESAFDVIQETDAWAFLEDGSGYRTFVTANGDIVRRLLTPLPPADAVPDFVFTEGVDIFDAARQHAVPPPTDTGALTASSEELDPESPPAFVSNPFYDPETDHPSIQQATLTTYREELFPPNSVVAITSTRLDVTTTTLFWLQAVTTAIDEQGAFTQQLQLIIGEEISGTGDTGTTADVFYIDNFGQWWGITATTLGKLGTSPYFTGIHSFDVPWATSETAWHVLPFDVTLGQDIHASADAGAAWTVPGVTGGTVAVQTNSEIIRRSGGLYYQAEGGIYTSDDGGLSFSLLTATDAGANHAQSGTMSGTTPVWLVVASGGRLEAHWNSGTGMALPWSDPLPPTGAITTEHLAGAVVGAVAIAVVNRNWTGGRHLLRITASGVTDLAISGVSPTDDSDWSLAYSADGTTWLLGWTDGDFTTSRIYRSTDGGLSWSVVREWSGSGGRTAEFVRSFTDATAFYGIAGDPIISVDGGDTWTVLTLDDDLSPASAFASMAGAGW